MTARVILIALLAGATPHTVAPDPIVQPGIITTAAGEVRIAHRPDGRRILWGAIGRDAAPEQQDIWEIHRTSSGWSAPARVAFDTDAAEFDPAFSPDGRTVYFQSDRAGGFGGNDLYAVAIDPRTGRFSTPRNLGSRINTRGDEWAATPTRQGGLIFSSDGWGGRGKHDLFEARLSGPQRVPVNLGAAINGQLDELDTALTADGQSLVFSSGDMAADVPHVTLFVSHRTAHGWSARAPLPIGCADFVLGASIDPRHPTRISYAAHCDGGLGRMDIHVADLAAGLRGIGGRAAR